MYQISIFETTGAVKGVNAAIRVVEWFQFEIFHDFNSNGNP